MNGEFYDRRDAGRRLAERLSAELEGDDVIVLGLPRGGVPVAAEVAEALGAPLEVFLVRKLGVPGHEELAMGAIASGGVRVLNEDVVGALGIGDEDIERVAGRELTELERRERAYREGRAAAELGGRTGVLVDDGLATGASMRAAVLAVRRSPRRAPGGLRGLPKRGRSGDLPPDAREVHSRRRPLRRLRRNLGRRGHRALASDNGRIAPTARQADILSRGSNAGLGGRAKRCSSSGPVRRLPRGAACRRSAIGDARAVGIAARRARLEPRGFSLL